MNRAQELIARIKKDDFRTVSEGEEEQEEDAPWMLKDDDANDLLNSMPHPGIQRTKPLMTRLSRLLVVHMISMTELLSLSSNSIWMPSICSSRNIRNSLTITA
jgi:hypothetical protein